MSFIHREMAETLAKDFVFTEDFFATYPGKINWVTNKQELKLTPEIKYVGGYMLGPGGNNYIRFNLVWKPSLWHRFWTRVFLGWRWIDD